jgi:ElaA protein
MKMKDNIKWELKKFKELTVEELYDILRLRSEVFVVEQHCVFLDMDDRDQNSYHLLGRAENKLVAYVRILPPGLAYDEPSIGRVVSSPSYRRKGAGKELMKTALKETYRLFGNLPIMIGAQLYLKEFYENMGFNKCSDIYLEDDIEHIKMINYYENGHLD